MKYFVLAACFACAHAPGRPLQLVESEPVETTLDRPALPDAYEVWPAMIAGAKERLDFAEMYAVDENPPTRLTPIIDAIFAASARGVHVRFLAEQHFSKTYPETLGALKAHGVEVRTLAKPFLHAKYFVVDGREAYLGSQNFDWRSLQHIEELGVRVQSREAVRELEDVFETDWTGTVPPARYAFPQDGLTLYASPQGDIPEEKLWELPAIVKLVEGARKTVRVQLLTYSRIPELEDALVAAAARGVEVDLLVSDWELRPRWLAKLRTLDPRVNVRIFTIPQATTGFVPFARVAHAKYCVVDGARGWVGTGNWEPEYFTKDRNVSVIAEQIAPQLEAFFLQNWASQYAAPFDRAREYAAPRISDGGGK